MNFLFAVDTDWLRKTFRTHYHYLTRYLTEKGHTVYVVDFPTHWQRTLEKEISAYDSTTGAHVFRPDFTHVPLLDRLTASRNVETLLKKIKESVEIDHIISGGITYTPALINLKTPITYFPIDLVSTEQFISNPVLRQVAHKWETRLCTTATTILVITKTMKAQLIRRGIKKDKIKIIKTGIDAETFKPTERTPNLLPTILYLGAIRKGYGLENFVKSKKYVEHPCTYCLVGFQRPETYGNQLKTLEETIVINPPVPHSQVPEIIDSADICVVTLPPREFSHSAFPIKLPEYMAMAKPIICTRLNGVQSQVKEKVYYCDPTPQGFADAVDHLLSNPEKMKELGEAGREYAKNHTWDKVLEPIEELLIGVTG